MLDLEKQRLTLVYRAAAALATGRLASTSLARSQASTRSFFWCFRGKAVGNFLSFMAGPFTTSRSIDGIS